MKPNDLREAGCFAQARARGSPAVARSDPARGPDDAERGPRVMDRSVLDLSAAVKKADDREERLTEGLLS
jgi:hypothetical protein